MPKSQGGHDASRSRPVRQPRENKREVCKVRGVYGTPACIVDYIVKHTVGRLLEGKTPVDVGPDRERPRRCGRAGAARHKRYRDCKGAASPSQYRDHEGAASPSQYRDHEGAASPSQYRDHEGAASPTQYRDRKGAAAPSQYRYRKGLLTRLTRRPRKSRRDFASHRDAAGSQGGAAPLRILDPACGSGSFLLGAYQYLLDWHRDWYVNDGPENHKTRIYQGPGGQWRLTVREKKRILLNHIYGVDIDPQAVEVTKLSLLLKVLEGETSETLGQTLRLFHERALPDLSSNIKCGNSLIGPDFYENRQMSVLDEEERYRINAFDWQAEFPEVFNPYPDRQGGADQRRRDREPADAGPLPLDTPPRRDATRNRDAISSGGVSRVPDGRGSDLAGGFDAVIGQTGAGPLPDGRGSDLAGGFDAVIGQTGAGPLPDGRGSDPAGGFDAVIGNPPYLSFSGRQAIEVSEAERVYFARHYQSAGWPTSHALFMERAVKDLSRCFAAFIVPDQVGHLGGYRPVREVITQCAGLTEVRYWGEAVFEGVVTPALTFVANKTHRGRTLIQQPDGERRSVQCEGGDAWTASEARGLLAKLDDNSHSLGDLVADPGVHTGNCSKKLILPAGGADPGCVPVLEGKQVSRYRCDRPRKVLKLDYAAKGAEYFTIRAKPRYTDAPFVIRQTAAYPIVGPRQHADYFRNSLLALYAPKDGTDVRYLVGVLNSRLMRYVYSQTVYESRQKAFPQVKVGSLRKLPIRALDLAEAKEKAQHVLMVELVQQMLDLHKRLAAAKTPTDRTAIQRQIDATDRQADRLVYELYDLTEEEVTIVEEATGKDREQR